MPCNSDHLAPNSHEYESHRCCKHLVYVFETTNKPVPKWIQEAVDSPYGCPNRIVEVTQLLCGLLRNMTPTEMDIIVYNGRNPRARRLADWWDEHQEADNARLDKLGRQARRRLERGLDQ